TSGAVGNGNGTVGYLVSANTSTASRNGSLSIAGIPFTIFQAGAVVIDNPPTAMLTAPTGGATLSGMATFSATATDDIGVSRVEFWCDGTVLMGTVTAAPYSFSANTATIPNGSHSFTCKSFDTTGHSTTSSAISATVNNTTGSAGDLQWVKSMLAPASPGS